jgi:hypothetical protein
MTDQNASVTVLMSSYNSARTLSEAVDSILGQTHRDLRLVVYDDASTDGTADLLRQYDDPRLDARLLAQNRGLTRNLAEGITESQTPYIARMDADDIAMPERLAEQVAYLEAHSDIDVLGTNVIFFDDFGHQAFGRQPEHHDDIVLALFFNFTMMHPTIMMRRTSLQAGDFNYDPHFRYSQDFDLWSRMIPSQRFANLQKPLLQLREHPNKISRAKRTDQQRFTTEIRARQTRCVLPDAVDRDIEVFVAAARGDILKSKNGIACLEDILLKLIDGNAAREIYDSDKFAAAAAVLFRDTCRRMLHQGNANGARYLRSPLRAFAPAEPLRPQVSFLALCGLAALGVRRKK